MKTPEIDALYTAAAVYGRVAEEALGIVVDILEGGYPSPDHMRDTAARLTDAADKLVEAAKSIGHDEAYGNGHAAGYDTGYETGFKDGRYDR